MEVELGAGGVVGVGEGGIGVVELLSHVVSLGALAGEDHGQAVFGGVAGDDLGGCVACCQGGQGFASLGDVSGEQDGAVFEGGSCGGQ